MKPFLVMRHVGTLLGILGVAMATSILVALFYEEERGLVSITISSAITFAAGMTLYLVNRKHDRNVTRRDAFAIVGIAWVAVGLFGALPYIISGVLTNPVDAFFESVSGFTTTGASVIASPSSIPKTILYWRSLTQWLGGMGIIVLFVAVFAELGVGGRFLFKGEVPGPIKDSVRPKIRDASSALWKIYFLLTAAETLALFAAGMNFFDALCHAFTTMSTGGFSTQDASIAAFGGGIPIIIIGFMVIAGVNFSLYHQLFLGRPRNLLRDRELWFYLSILAAASILVFVNIIGIHDSPVETLKHAMFQVVSLTTTTGYVTDDFNTWPPFSKIALVMLMFVGGCAGSTAGGMKVIRFLILFKLMHRGLYRLVRPRVVMPIRIGRQVIPDSSVEETAGFFFLFICVFVVVTLFVSAHGLDMITSFSSVAATLSNIGPGLAKIGAVEHYGNLPASVKLVLSGCMILGRLELYTVLSLTLPIYWRR